MAPATSGATGAAAGIFEHVVPNGLCVGCGVCAGLCPEALSMNWSPPGQYLPAATDNEGDAERWAALSLAVCPFADEGDDEDALGQGLYGDVPGIRHRSQTGFYLSCYVGFVADEPRRLAASSGGITTWLLADLLRHRLVDAVLCVGPSARPDTLFGYRVVRHASELAECRKSRYYPVELSGVIREIRGSGERVAVVGVPCVVKAVRRAMQADAGLRTQVRYTFGLFCGHLKTRQYADFLARCCGLDERDMTMIDFRHKIPGRAASDYGIEVQAHDSGPAQVRRVRDLFGSSWSLNLFMLDACDCCDDVVAETADVSCGDAWLHPFTDDYRGHNLVICRHPELHARLTAAAAAGELVLQRLPVDSVIASQAGAFRHRRAGLAFRLHQARRLSQWRPRKRVRPDAAAGTPFGRLVQRLRQQTKRRSREAFSEQQGRPGLDHFMRAMRPWVLLHEGLYGVWKACGKTGRRVRRLLPWHWAELRETAAARRRRRQRLATAKREGGHGGG